MKVCPCLRVHELEEMVKDQETTAEQALEEEARRHREAYSKLEREKSTELELLNTRCVCTRSVLMPFFLAAHVDGETGPPVPTLLFLTP
jgi:hypothetical protein